MIYPKTLEGYQNICGRVVEKNDLVIPPWALSHEDWVFASATHLVGQVTQENGKIDEFRIYRPCPCPSHLDDKMMGSCNARSTVDDFRTNPDDVAKAVATPPKAKTHDEGKAPLAYLPWDGLREVAMVQEYGHRKYGDFYNYRKGMEVGRNLSCAMRHIADYMDGKDLDHESKRSHLAHACCRLLFVLQNIADGTAIDDRYKGIK